MYKINIKPENCKYIVNKDNNKVVCIIDNTSRLFTRFMERNFQIQPDNVIDFKNYDRLERKLYMPNRFWGVATCSKDDEWNEETGKLIAYSRAREKLNRSFFKRAKTYINTLDKWLDESVEILNDLGEKFSDSAARRQEKIDAFFTPVEK